MAQASARSQSPAVREMRAALARVVKSGPDEAINHSEASPLLELPAVRARIEAEGSAVTADAIVEVLAQAAKSVPSVDYRRLLVVVLGLDPPYRALAAGQRRDVAGEQFRGGSRPVGSSTVRQVHEPRALDELAEALALTATRDTEHPLARPIPPRPQPAPWPFGTPDGNAAGLEDALSSFVTFTGRRFRDGLGMGADERGVRVIVGSKGSGKTLYIRRLQAAAQREPSLYADRWQPGAPATGDILRVAGWSRSEFETLERWERIWYRATLAAVSSHILAAPGRSFDAARDQFTEAFDEHQPQVLSDSRSPRSIYDEVSRIIRAHEGGQQLDRFLDDPQWAAVEYALSRSVPLCPPMFFYLDALDERFEAAPRQWLFCQLGLFRFVMSSRSYEQFGSRIHVIVTIRDIVFSMALASEHSSRYLHNPAVRKLNWDVEAIRQFLDRKIESLPDEWLFGPRDARPVDRWLGLPALSTVRGYTEPIDDFLLRHTRLLPRDIVVLGNELCHAQDECLDLGEPVLTQETVLRVVSRVARRFGQEELRVAANHLAASLMPAEALQYGFADTYVADEPDQPAPLQRHLTSEIAELLRTLGTDRFTSSKLQKFDALADQRLGAGTDLGSVLWQHRLIGYIDGNVEDGPAYFYGAAAESEFNLPRGFAGYALHPIVIEAIPGLKGTGAPVLPR